MDLPDFEQPIGVEDVFVKQRPAVVAAVMQRAEDWKGVLARRSADIGCAGLPDEKPSVGEPLACYRARFPLADTLAAQGVDGRPVGIEQRGTMNGWLWMSAGFALAGPIVALLASWWLARRITNSDDYGPVIAGVLLCAGLEMVAVIMVLVGLAVKVL
jgi:hypothetical protein